MGEAEEAGEKGEGGGDVQWGKDQEKEIAKRRVNGDLVDKKIRSLMGGRLSRIARETSPELPIFYPLVLIFILAPYNSWLA